MNTQSLLERLNIRSVNPGVCTGPDGWLDSGAPPLVSLNPTTAEPLAQVVPATPEAVEKVIAAARAGFEAWRQLPAPRRGLVVRDLGAAVRESLEPLGELITLEMGKIRAEGIGEVQEMIDVCDFAVGLSRQLYGLTMPSERPGHRMAEQWHPLGPIGVITAFNFPIAVWSWNAAIAAVCGDTVVWKPSELTPLTAVAMQHIANRVMADHGLSGVFTLAVGGPDVGRQLVADERLPLISFTGSTATGRSTMMRRVEGQRCPAVPTAPKTMARVARSRSASAATTMALLPPSSRIARPSRAATAWATARPTAVEPVKERTNRSARLYSSGRASSSTAPVKHRAWATPSSSANAVNAVCFSGSPAMT